jgi:hypothetical protein
VTLLVAAAFSFAAADTPTTQPAKALSLEKSGEQRKLPPQLLGASAEAMIEHLISDQAKVAVLKGMDLSFVRFPGGSQANYYDWRTGQLHVETTENSSDYMRFWAQAAPKINARSPKGVCIQDYAKFAKEINAESVLVANLETSTLADQTEWFRQMKKDGIAPRHVELGNEFYIAMVFDPEVMKKWPSEPATMKIMKQYADAFRPLLPDGAKMAVQSSASAFHMHPHAAGPKAQRLLQWDENLKPEPWFDAVVIHLYPHIDEIMSSPGSSKGWVKPDEAPRLFKALLARCDEGVDRVVTDVARRLPGKEIWVTEWNPRGVDHTSLEQPPPGMLALLVSRMTSAYLRHPEVTMSLYFMLDFLQSGPHHVFDADGKGGYEPSPQIVAVRWFDEAANGGITYQRLVEAGAKPVATDGWRHESFREVEAALFSWEGRRTLIVENCSDQPRNLQIPKDIGTDAPFLIETLASPDITAAKAAKPQTLAVKPGGEVQIPAYSLTRIIWRSPQGGASAKEDPAKNPS